MKNPIKTKEKKFKLQGSYKFQGLPISVENRAGSERTGTDKDGNKWSTKMLYDYGFIRDTEATDGEGVDAFINRESNGKKENYHKKEGEPEMVDTDVYVVHQKQGEKSKKWPNGICPDCHKHHTECKCPQYYDEDKVMLGFESKEAAIEAYLKHYDSPRFLGPVSTYTLPEFKTALKNSTGKKLPYVVKKHEHWTGVDLDGTLAKDDGWKGKDHIGEPVEKMRERIMAHLDKGDKVKLLTARASDPKAIPPIKQWMKENNIPILEITNKKDPGMINLYDDRVTQVKKNTGELIKSISQTYYVDLDKAIPNKETDNIVTFKVNNAAKTNVLQILRMLSSMGMQGASRTVDLDDFGKFGFDGDGADRLWDIKINGILLKNIVDKDGKIDYSKLEMKKSLTIEGPEQMILSAFMTVEDLLEDPEGLYQDFGRENETKDDFLIRMTRMIRDSEFNQATEYHVSNEKIRFENGSFVYPQSQEVFKSCGKVHEMDKSYLGQEGDTHGSRSMLRENLDKPYYVYRPPTTMSGMLDEIEKSYPDNAMECESADDYFRRMSREHSNAQVRELLEKAFVRVPAHTRAGKHIPEYHYITDRSKKIADVRHQTKTRVDYGKKEADAKIAELHKKKEHHDMHIQAANDLKEKVEADRKAGKSTYKIGDKEHNINKVLKDLNDHIKHHVNEKKSHDNHIQKIQDRHKTEQAYWDKKKEERNAKQQALDELIKDGKHKGEMLESDVLDVLKRMKERETKKIEVKKELPAETKNTQNKPAVSSLTDNLIKFIKEQTGLDLKVDQDSGIIKKKGEKYFNVVLDQRVSESRELPILERLAKNSKVITKVEPNGLNKVAIFFKEEAGQPKPRESKKIEVKPSTNDIAKKVEKLGGKEWEHPSTKEKRYYLNVDLSNYMGIIYKNDPIHPGKQKMVFNGRTLSKNDYRNLAPTGSSRVWITEDGVIHTQSINNEVADVIKENLKKELNLR